MYVESKNEAYRAYEKTCDFKLHCPPARSKGETTVQVRVGNIQKELGWTEPNPIRLLDASLKRFPGRSWRRAY